MIEETRLTEPYVDWDDVPELHNQFSKDFDMDLAADQVARAFLKNHPKYSSCDDYRIEESSIENFTKLVFRFTVFPGTSSRRMIEITMQPLGYPIG